MKISLRQQDIENMIRDCQQRESKLSVWEQSFIQSLEEQYDAKDDLSDKQYDKLGAIWEKVTG